jgi:asparagine synthase (glutamine-hydrolysing)
MSGICGSTNDSQRTRVVAMNAAMAARRPEAYRTYTDFFSGVSLGTRRLSNLELRSGSQPVTNESSTVWAVLDGEVSNHPELRKGLAARGHRFASSADAEVLVHLYEEKSIALVHAIQGSYAFGLWDARRKELLVVRDRAGQRWLFYTEQGSDLFFASELDVVLAGIHGKPDVAPTSVDASLVSGSVPGQESIIRGVKHVPPGHILRWEQRSTRVSLEPYQTPMDEPEHGSQQPFVEPVAHDRATI